VEKWPGKISLSAETEKLFRSLLKDLRPLSKESGFRASSQNFILESAECWVIVNFQRSRWGDRDETTFYCSVPSAEDPRGDFGSNEPSQRSKANRLHSSSKCKAYPIAVGVNYRTTIYSILWCSAAAGHRTTRPCFRHQLVDDFRLMFPYNHDHEPLCQSEP
jgi:hypothetical protein